MIVIFDSNIWISDLALKSNLGSAVRFYLRQRKAHIGLPEVVKLETELHLRSLLNEHIETIHKSYRQLLPIFGRLKEIVLPASDEVEELISQVFSNLGVEINEIPFTLASAKAALIRTVRKIPPSDRSQQYKDCVLWEDCLNALGRESVYLVTDDHAFYSSRKPEVGLAEELRKDLNRSPNELRIFPSLQDLLYEIKTKIDIDPTALISAYLNIHGEIIKRMAANQSLVLGGGDPTVEFNVFCTEKPTLLYLTFTMTMPCTDTTNEGRTTKILAQGRGSYDAESRRFVELARGGEQLLYQVGDGTEVKLQNTVMALGGIVLGHRTVEHTVRFKL